MKHSLVEQSYFHDNDNVAEEVLLDLSRIVSLKLEKSSKPVGKINTDLGKPVQASE